MEEGEVEHVEEDEELKEKERTNERLNPLIEVVKAV